MPKRGYVPRRTVKQLARLRFSAILPIPTTIKHPVDGAKVKGEEVPLLADIYGLQQPLSGAAVRIGAGIARAIPASRMHLFSHWEEGKFRISVLFPECRDIKEMTCLEIFLCSVCFSSRLKESQCNVLTRNDISSNIECIFRRGKIRNYTFKGLKYIPLISIYNYK